MRAGGRVLTETTTCEVRLSLDGEILQRRKNIRYRTGAQCYSMQRCLGGLGEHVIRILQNGEPKSLVIATQRSKSFDLPLFHSISQFWSIGFYSNHLKSIFLWTTFSLFQIWPLGSAHRKIAQIPRESAGESEAIPGLELALRHMFLGVPWRRRWLGCSRGFHWCGTLW